MKKKITCPQCKGKGQVNRPAPVMCPGCGGEKWVYVKDHPKNEEKLFAAILICRRMIRGELIEHAVVNSKKPNEGLGEYLDKLIKEVRG